MDSEAYIAQVLSHLPGELEGREEIAMEIRSTIAERSAAGEPLWQTLEQLGSPLELAESYLVDVELRSATLGRRLVAKFVDLMIPLFGIILYIVLAGVAMASLGKVPLPATTTGVGLLAVFGTLLVVWAILILYPALSEWRFERTLGKHLMGLRVVRESGARISLKQSVLRQLPWLAFQGLWVIDGIFALFSDKRQRAAEMLTHTRTVLKRSAQAIVALLLLQSVGSLAAQAAPRLSATVELTIGAGDPAGPYILERVGSLASDAQGRIYVTQPERHEVRVFSAAGKFLYTIGQKGQGTGDLSDPCCLAFAPNGTLWMEEYGNRRFSIFSVGATRATFLYSIRKPLTNAYLDRPDRLSWDGKGRLIDIAGTPSSKGSSMGMRRSVIDSTGKVWSVDTISAPPKDSLNLFAVEKDFNGTKVGMDLPQPHGPEALRAIGPKGDVARAVSSRYAIEWLDASGHRIALMQRSVVGPALSDRERAADEKRIATMTKSFGRELPFKAVERKPPLLQLGFDLDGRLWVRKSVTDGAPSEADIYDRTGKLVATASWPANIDLTSWAIRGDSGLAVQYGQDDEVHVVRIRFRKN